MADPAAGAGAVNGQITDSITQVNTKIIGDSPAVSMGNLMIATGQALATAAHNATYGQQQTMVNWQATTVQGINSLYSLDTTALGKVVEGIIKVKTA